MREITGAEEYSHYTNINETKQQHINECIWREDEQKTNETKVKRIFLNWSEWWTLFVSLEIVVCWTCTHSEHGQTTATKWKLLIYWAYVKAHR